MGKNRAPEITGMRTIAILSLVAASTMAAILAAFWILQHAAIYDVVEFPMEVYVGNKIGINVGTDSVYFGIVPPGASSGREMTVTAGGFRTIVSFESAGDIAPWVTVSENNFVLGPWENRTVMIDVYVPADITPLAYRNGTLRMVFRRA